jgi:hypothetical protein
MWGCQWDSDVKLRTEVFKEKYFGGMVRRGQRL